MNMLKYIFALVFFQLTFQQELKNMMALFYQDCPPGWTQQVLNRNEFIRIASSQMPANSRGGNENITLTINNLPPHSHNSGVGAFYHKYGGGQFHGGHVTGLGSFQFWYDASSSTVGNGQPFKTTPVYVALNLCKFQKNTNFSLLTDSLQTANLQVKQLEKQLIYLKATFDSCNGYSLANLILGIVSGVSTVITVIVSIVVCCLKIKISEIQKMQLQKVQNNSTIEKMI